jgi:hypothetical protein
MESLNLPRDPVSHDRRDCVLGLTGRCVPELIRLQVRLTGMLQFWQGFDRPNVSQHTGGHTPDLAVGIAFQSIQERRHDAVIAIILESDVGHPAHNCRRVVDPGEERVGCLPTVQQRQSLNRGSTVFVFTNLETGFKHCEHFGFVNCQKRSSRILERLRIRKSLPPGVEKLLDQECSDHENLEERTSTVPEPRLCPQKGGRAS